MKCNRCDGKGTIPGYAHINEGRCFKCNGSGKMAEPKRGSRSYAQAFIYKYARMGDDVSDASTDGDGFFPILVADHGKVIDTFMFIGHPTAEGKVIYFNHHFYVGQPVCRSSSWYRVPEDVWDEFIYAFNRVNIYKLSIK